jgi:hypothetical protein
MCNFVSVKQTKIPPLYEYQGLPFCKNRELFEVGLGKYNLRKLRSWGIDEHDIEIFKKHRKDLTTKQQT